VVVVVVMVVVVVVCVCVCVCVKVREQKTRTGSNLKAAAHGETTTRASLCVYRVCPSCCVLEVRTSWSCCESSWRWRTRGTQ